ncbi:MAG TPA: hypothetical protein VMV49_06860 [Candidatus Deferrimicrobium sp.]|nr:hypothetical protein [Candidatus Deferrimicrobium sp.]
MHRDIAREIGKGTVFNFDKVEKPFTETENTYHAAIQIFNTRRANSASRI